LLGLFLRVVFEYDRGGKKPCAKKRDPPHAQVAPGCRWSTEINAKTTKFRLQHIYAPPPVSAEPIDRPDTSISCLVDRSAHDRRWSKPSTANGAERGIWRTSFTADQSKKAATRPMRTRACARSRAPPGWPRATRRAPRGCTDLSPRQSTSPNLWCSS